MHFIILYNIIYSSLRVYFLIMDFSCCCVGVTRGERASHTSRRLTWFPLDELRVLLIEQPCRIAEAARSIAQRVFSSVSNQFLLFMRDRLSRGCIVSASLAAFQLIDVFAITPPLAYLRNRDSSL